MNIEIRGTFSRNRNQHVIVMHYGNGDKPNESMQ